MRHNRTKIII